jgi:hypothetical protein
MKRTALVLLILLCAQLAAAAEYLHPRLKSKQVSIRAVAILPVRIEVEKSGVKGSETMMAESEKIVDGVASLVSRLLKSHGLAVLEDALGPVEGSGEVATEERRSTLAALQSRFDAVAPQLQSKPKDVQKGRFTLGDEVAGLISSAADAFVIVRGRGVVSTKGKAFLTGGLAGMMLAPKGTLQCDIAIVDARTGDILFFSRSVGRGDIVKAAGGQLEKPILKSLKKLPVSS